MTAPGEAPPPAPPPADAVGETADVIDAVPTTSGRNWHEEVEEDWQQQEISKLLEEVKTLRHRKEGLESQIRNAEDANASWQSSWSALSRVSTTAPASAQLSPAEEADASWLDERQRLLDQVTELEALHGRLEMESMEVFRSRGKEPRDGTQILASAHDSLAEERSDLAAQLHDAQAALSHAEQQCSDVQRRLRFAEEQASDLAGPLAELGASRTAVDDRLQNLDGLERKAERVETALTKLAADHKELVEADVRLQAELHELSTEVVPRSDQQIRQAALEVEQAQATYFQAKTQWEREAQHRREAQDAEERQLAKLLARQESSSLAATQGRETCAHLRQALQDTRAEHSRLIRIQQQALWSVGVEPSDDFFGLRAKHADLKASCARKQAEIQELSAAVSELGALEAELQQQRLLEVEQGRREQEALEDCTQRLNQLSLAMSTRAEALQSDLLNEHEHTEKLRRELAAARQAGATQQARKKSEPLGFQPPARRSPDRQRTVATLMAAAEGGGFVPQRKASNVSAPQDGVGWKEVLERRPSSTEKGRKSAGPARARSSSGTAIRKKPLAPLEPVTKAFGVPVVTSVQVRQSRKSQGENANPEPNVRTASVAKRRTASRTQAKR